MNIKALKISLKQMIVKRSAKKSAHPSESFVFPRIKDRSIRFSRFFREKMSCSLGVIGYFRVKKEPTHCQAFVCFASKKAVSLLPVHCFVTG